MDDTPTTHKEESGIQIVAVQFGNYNRPDPVESKFDDWVMYGKNNKFYQDIIDRNNGSPTNSSINRTLSEYIYGKGIRAKNARENINDWTRFKSILNDKDLRKICTDFQVFGQADMEIIQTKGKELTAIYHQPKQLIIPQLENEDGVIENYWFSKDWNKRYENIPIAIPAFSGKNKKEIYSIKPYQVGQKYFSDPDYVSALSYAEAEEEIANMNLNSIKKGLSAGYIINIPGGLNWDDKQKKDFQKDIRKQLTGSENASDFILSFNAQNQDGITITPFPVNENIHKQWESLNETCSSKILTAHRVPSPSIVGLISSSGFSNTADEMLQARLDLVDYVIKPKQKFIIDALQDVLVQYGLNLDLYFEQLVSKPEVVEPPIKLSSQGANPETLIALGEDLPEGYEIISDDRCDKVTLKEIQLNTVFKFASAPVTPRKNSEQDTSLFKIRYAYAGAAAGERDFCKKVINANKLYREEDLNFNSVYNEDFAPSGSSSYNVFLYKGGVNCKHWWQRIILLKKDNGIISTTDAVKMILELDPSQRKDAKWDANAKEVAQVASPFNNWWSKQPGYRTI